MTDFKNYNTIAKAIRRYSIIVLAFLSCLLVACNREDTVQQDNEEPDLIERVKAGYYKQFEDLRYYKKFIETPLWDEYWAYEDSVATYVYVPFEQVTDYAAAQLIVRLSENGADYHIKISNISFDVANMPREQKIVGLYSATKDNNILRGGYIKDDYSFVLLREIILVPATTKGSDDESCCSCLCDETLECYCEYIEEFGECLEAVYIIGKYNCGNDDSGGSGGGSGSGGGGGGSGGGGGASGSGSSSGGGGGGGGGGGNADPPVSVTLSISQSTVTIMDWYNLTVNLSVNTEVLDVSYEIGKAGDFAAQQWIIQSGGLTCSARAKKSGTWKIRAVVTLYDATTVVSNTVNLTVQYPDVNTVKNNGTVSSNMSAVWQATKNAASSSGRYEKGFVIYANTTTFAYECGTVSNGTTVSCGTVAGIGYISSESSANLSPVTGGRYIVATFHTHTPLTYCSNTYKRPTGPSSVDISEANGLPGILYDYVGQYFDDVKYTGIIGGHSINAASQIYLYGPNRRSTPNF